MTETLGQALDRSIAEIEETLPPKDHYNPPDPLEALKADLEHAYAHIMTRGAELAEAFERVPETIEDHETAARAGDFMKQIGAFLKTAEEGRKKAKDPLTLSTKTVDFFFDILQAPINNARAIVQDRLTAYQKGQRGDDGQAPLIRGDHGSATSLTSRWDFEVEDIHAIPLETLRPHFTPDAINRAIRQFIGNEGRALKGVRILEKQTAVTR